MTDSALEHCSCIKLEDGRSLYFSIKAGRNGEKDLWNIIFTDGNKIYETEVSADDLADMALPTKYSPSQYIDLFKMAFNLRKRDDNTHLKYTLAKLTSGKDRFFWSLFLPKDDKTLGLGQLDISPLAEKDRPPVYCRMFDSLLTVRDQCQRDAQACRDQCEEEKSVSKSALTKLEKYVAIQEQGEKALYSNFVDILNEKKRKIRELQDQCESLKQSLADNSMDTNSAVQDSVADEVPTAAKRGRGRQPAAAKRSAKRVSACTARKQQRGKAAAGVGYNSDEGAAEEQSQEIRPSASAKRNRQLVQSSDSEATEVDEAEEMSVDKESDRVPTRDTQPNRSNTGAESETQPFPDEIQLKVEPTRWPGISTDLDDLLGDVRPKTAHKSPVKRKSLRRAAQQTKAADSPMTQRSDSSQQIKSKNSKDNPNLLDDLGLLNDM